MSDLNAEAGPDPFLEQSEDKSLEILYEFQVRTAFSNPLTIVLGNFVNAAIVFAVVQGHVSDMLINAWAGALAVVVLGRVAIFYGYQRIKPKSAEIRSWAVLYAIGTIATGIIWGAAGWSFALPDVSHTQLVTAIIIAGMVAGALSTNRTLPHLFVAFALSAVLPLTVRFLTFGQFEYVLLACAFVLFLVLMSGQAFTISRQLKTSEQRRLANLALVESLRTAKKNAEAGNAAKTQFLATVSHEIRTPMTGVMGFADALLGDDIPAGSKDKVRRIKQSTESLLGIINEVLDLSKLEAGRMEIENLDFHLPSLLGNVVSMFEGSGRPGLEIALSLADGLPKGVHGDPTRLRQVLINVVGNAVKFTKQGRITLSAERRSGSDKGDVLYFAVTDTGIGISEEVLPKLFTDFTQADSSISREFEGTGLGLSICKRLVELMGGEIGVESELGVGSTFWFTLPYRAAMSDVVEQGVVAEAATDIKTLRPLHILVAEDNQINQMIISQTLDRFGHTYEMVGDGAEAVKALEAKTYDLILMDVRMPNVSGPEATRMIRRLAGDKAKVPIIALTADAMLEHQKGYFEAGMNGVSTKPIDRLDLARTINEVMGEEIHGFVKKDVADGGSETTADIPLAAAAENEAVTDFLASLDGFASDRKSE